MYTTRVATGKVEDCVRFRLEISRKIKIYGLWIIKLSSAEFKVSKVVLGNFYVVGKVVDSRQPGSSE